MADVFWLSGSLAGYSEDVSLLVGSVGEKDSFGRYPVTINALYSDMPINRDFANDVGSFERLADARRFVEGFAVRAGHKVVSARRAKIDMGLLSNTARS